MTIPDHGRHRGTISRRTQHGKDADDDGDVVSFCMVDPKGNTITGQFFPHQRVDPASVLGERLHMEVERLMSLTCDSSQQVLTFEQFCDVPPKLVDRRNFKKWLTPGGCHPTTLLNWEDRFRVYQNAGQGG